MSLLVRYTLKSADDHDRQTKAMADLVVAIKSEGVPVQYSCFSTDVATEFLGVLEFADQAAFEAFQASAAFAAYRERVGPTFANPPQTTPITAIATTRI
jgi:quinol monooxygenase YgiN